MHKFISPSSSNLMLYYDFNHSSGTTVSDKTSNGYNGTLTNMTNSSWVTSTAPIGVYGTQIRNTNQTTAGQSGKSLSATVTTGGDDVNYLGIYTYGDGDARIGCETYPDGISQRTNYIWAVREFGNCTSNIVFDYSGIGGAISSEASLKLMKRSDPSGTWTDVTGSATQSLTNHTFTINDITEFSEFSIGDAGANPLPVELNSFSAKMNNGSVILSWMTETEVNNYGFEVERTSLYPSKGGTNENWEKVGLVHGNGNSNSQKNYSFVDNNPPSGKVLYRLKQIDNDGSFKYYDYIEVNVGVPERTELHQNYPNPFNPTTAIKFSLNMETKIKIVVYDILGNVVNELVNETKPAGNHIVFWNSNDSRGNKVASGVYFYRLEAGDIIQIKKMNLVK